MSDGKKNTESPSVHGGITKLRKMSPSGFEDEIDYYNALVKEVEELREFESYIHVVIVKIQFQLNALKPDDKCECKKRFSSKIESSPSSVIKETDIPENQICG